MSQNRASSSEMKVNSFWYHTELSCSTTVDLDAEEEKERESSLKEKFEPLLLWLAAEASGVVRNGERFGDYYFCGWSD